MMTEIYNNNFLLYQENNNHDNIYQRDNINADNNIYEGFDATENDLDAAQARAEEQQRIANEKQNDFFTHAPTKSVKQLMAEGKNRKEILKESESKASNFSRNIPHWPLAGPITSAIDSKYEWHKRAHNPKAWLWNNVNTPIGEEDTMLAGVFKHNKLLQKLGLNNPGSHKSRALGDGISVMTAIINGIFPIIFIICFMLFLKLMLQGDEGGMGSISLKNSAFNLTNIFKLLIFISSYIITFFLLFFTIVTNRIIKGIFLIFGISILLVVTKFLKKIFSVYQDSRTTSLYCNILSSPFTVAGSQGIYSVPSTNISVLSFIFFIMTSSMVKNRKEYDFNYPLFLLLLMMIIIVSVTEYFEGCVPKLGIFVAIVVGIIYSFIYIAVLKSIDKHNIDYANIFQMDDENSICGLNKVSKINTDGSLIPNENTKYFKCVTKKRKESDFIGREKSEDTSSDDVNSNTPSNNWDGKIVLSRRTPVGYYDFSKIKFTIYGLTKISNAEDMTPKFKYTDQDKLHDGTCDSTYPSFNINGYKYYGIYFKSTLQPPKKIIIKNVKWTPNKRINNSLTGNEFDLMYYNNTMNEELNVASIDKETWFVVEPKIDNENKINLKYSIE
tara:strand:+ start:9767 stop:11605 length:1839 start_codon:yes stop_codon:yes gene_type:complete